jgi:hypothetical protein
MFKVSEVADDLEVDQDPEREAAPAFDASLAARMQRRRQAVEGQVTEKFPVPGWDDMVVVELKPLSWPAMRKIGERHARIRDQAMQELYTFCDHLIYATVAFHEVVGENTRPTSHTWISLAQAGVQNLPEDVTNRKAMLALIRDQLVPELWNDWREWQKHIGQDTEEEVAADFVTTG